MSGHRHKSLTITANYEYSSIGRYAVVGCKLQYYANEGCKTCASLAGLLLIFIVVVLTFNLYFVSFSFYCSCELVMRLPVLVQCHCNSIFNNSFLTAVISRFQLLLLLLHCCCRRRKLVVGVHHNKRQRR